MPAKAAAARAPLAASPAANQRRTNGGAVPASSSAGPAAALRTAGARAAAPAAASGGGEEPASPSKGGGGLLPQSWWGGGHSNQQQAEAALAPQPASASPQLPPEPLSAWSPALPVSGQGWEVGAHPITSSFAPAAGQPAPSFEHTAFIGANRDPKQLPPSGRSAGRGQSIDGGPVIPGSSPPRTAAQMPAKRHSEAESELDDELMASLIPDLGIGLAPARGDLAAAIAAAENALSGLVSSKGGPPAEGDPDSGLQQFPTRAGHPVCDFYQKTGHCKVTSHTSSLLQPCACQVLKCRPPEVRPPPLPAALSFTSPYDKAARNLLGRAF